MSRRVVDSAGVGTAFTCPHALDNPARRLSTLPTTPTTTASQPFYYSLYWKRDAVLLISDAVSGDRFLLEHGFLTLFFVIK